MAEPKLALVERFYSVQGEGFNSGRAAIFVRFAGCNLACDFAGDGTAICDTPWQEAGEKITLGDLLGWITDMGSEKNERPMVVLTGGEPTMAPQFDDLALGLRERGFYVAVETNGTIWRPSLNRLDWVCVSPKQTVPQGNTVHGDPLADPEVSDKVRWLPPDEYRYVVGGPTDPVPPFYLASRHYVSPAIQADGSGTSHMDGFPGFADGAVERCMEIVQEDPRWRVSLQTHKFMGAR